MPKEKRPNRIEFQLTDQELESLRARMDNLDIRNTSAYLRKMALNGYILTLDMPELKELITLMRYTSNNINQIAKRLNATGRAYEDDVREIRAQQQKLWDGINEIIIRLGKDI